MLKESRQGETAEEKIKHLFTENYGKWLGYAMKRNIRREDAEDIIQDVTVRILEKKDVLMQLPGTDLEAYMMESLKNAIKNAVTRKKRFEPLQEEYFPAEESAEEIVLTELKYEAMKMAVGELSETQRDIIYMNYYQNIGVSQIAEKTGMTDNAVRTYKSRAAKVLRRILANIG